MKKKFYHQMMGTAALFAALLSPQVLHAAGIHDAQVTKQSFSTAWGKDLPKSATPDSLVLCGDTTYGVWSLKTKSGTKYYFTSDRATSHKHVLVTQPKQADEPWLVCQDGHVYVRSGATARGEVIFQLSSALKLTKFRDLKSPADYESLALPKKYGFVQDPGRLMFSSEPGLFGGVSGSAVITVFDANGHANKITPPSFIKDIAQDYGAYAQATLSFYKTTTGFRVQEMTEATTTTSASPNDTVRVIRYYDSVGGAPYQLVDMNQLGCEDKLFAMFTPIDQTHVAYSVLNQFSETPDTACFNTTNQHADALVLDTVAPGQIETPFNLHSVQRIDDTHVELAYATSNAKHVFALWHVSIVFKK